MEDYKNLVGEGYRYRLGRRHFLLAAAALLSAGILSEKIPRLYDGSTSQQPRRYFRAVKKDNKTTYIKGEILGESRVFEIVDEKPWENAGIEYLVKRENPKYNYQEVTEVAELATQLFRNPELNELKLGEERTIYYDAGKKLGFLQPHTFYPIPKQIGISKLK